MNTPKQSIIMPYHRNKEMLVYTTTLLESGIPESVVQQIIGWSSADMISIYDDRDKDDLIGEYFKNGEITSKQKNDLSNL